MAMINHLTMLEALRAASLFIFGENLEVDCDIRDEQLETAYNKLLSRSLSIDGTSFKFAAKYPGSLSTYECTIGEPEDILLMVKPSADPLPESTFFKRDDYIAKADLIKYYKRYPHATKRGVLKHFHINPYED